MKLKALFVFGLVLFLSLSLFQLVFAEDKNTPGGIIPKLPKTVDDPELFEGHVYPNWGPPCQRYTYSVIYRDKEGREPQYMKIYFNGQMIDMQKENSTDNNYKQGVKYTYKYVPNKIDSNFYYFEASNGKGRARASIIDSPDNGPVLFTTPFDKNEVSVVDKSTGQKILNFPTGKEWIGGVALSDNGQYLAVKTSQHVYLFDTEKPNKPLWQFNCEQCRIGDDVKGGAAISGDGSKIIAAFGERVALFDKSSNKPIWIYEKAGNSYNVAISKDGRYMAAATAGNEEDTNSNLIILWQAQSEKPLWQYHALGNFHDVSLSQDGQFISGSTGCPDRRFYLFSRDSNKPIIQSDPLTRDSPVHRAKISSDGSTIAVGSESDSGAVFMFDKKSKSPVWKFSTPNNSSVRALNFTPNGKYIGAATFGGDAYIFDEGKNSPIASWKVNASLGGADIADDGSFMAVGGTDKKLYILDKTSKSKTEIPFNEYLEEIDISANGKYIAAGTGGSVYFFETYLSQDREKVFDCSSVAEPVSESEMRTQFETVKQGSVGQLNLLEMILDFIRNIFKSKIEVSSGKSACGNDLCEPGLGETRQNCPKDCSAGD
ncbi:MAG: WD40 repeat domain-containing protein [Candidatus Levyibacteriota bacterium]|nr:MAG: WD40 repeat domain-containing protein [Candidatus Levybacteria bacterium]